MTLNFLGACLHVLECGGYSRTEAVRGTPDARAAPPATARVLSASALTVTDFGELCFKGFRRVDEELPSNSEPIVAKQLECANFWLADNRTV